MQGFLYHLYLFIVFLACNANAITLNFQHYSDDWIDLETAVIADLKGQGFSGFSLYQFRAARLHASRLKGLGTAKDAKTGEIAVVVDGKVYYVGNRSSDEVIRDDSYAVYFVTSLKVSNLQKVLNQDCSFHLPLSRVSSFGSSLAITFHRPDGFYEASEIIPVSNMADNNEVILYLVEDNSHHFLSKKAEQVVRLFLPTVTGQTTVPGGRVTCFKVEPPENPALPDAPKPIQIIGEYIFHMLPKAPTP